MGPSSLLCSKENPERPGGLGSCGALLKEGGLTVSHCSQGADAEDPADQHQSPTKHQGPGGGGQGEDPEGAAPAWPRGWGRALGGGNPSVLLSSDLLLGSQGASRELSGLLHSSLLLANTWGLELSFPPSSTQGSLQKSPVCSHQAEQLLSLASFPLFPSLPPVFAAVSTWALPCSALDFSVSEQPCVGRGIVQLQGAGAALSGWR